MSDNPGFDYESALWGAEELVPGERSIAGYRLAEALVHLPQRGRVLEVGCGGGRFLRALARARPQLELVGADVSRAALSVLTRAEPDIEAREAPASGALPARDAEFDAVLAIDVIEHLEDPAHMFSEIRRVLAPGGVLHAHVPCEGDALSPWRWLPGQAGERGLKRRFGGHLQRFTRRELLALLTHAGFEPLRVRYGLHLVGALADVALFAGMALRQRLRPQAAPATTGDVMARAAQTRQGTASVSGLGVRAVDALVWAEAKMLGRIPSWAVHVSARRVR